MKPRRTGRAILARACAPRCRRAATVVVVVVARVKPGDVPSRQGTFPGFTRATNTLLPRSPDAIRECASARRRIPGLHPGYVCRDRRGKPPHACGAKRSVEERLALRGGALKRTLVTPPTTSRKENFMAQGHLSPFGFCS